MKDRQNRTLMQYVICTPNTIVHKINRIRWRAIKITQCGIQLGIHDNYFKKLPSLLNRYNFRRCKRCFKQ